MMKEIIKMLQTSTKTTREEHYATEIVSKGIIQLTGEEKIKYLQGQVTADISKLSAEHAMLACHCDFKGKVWSVFYTLLWQDSILLVTHKSAVEKSLGELNKYGVFAKVEITEQTKNWQIIGGKGEQFESELLKVFGALPSGSNNAVSNDNGIVISIQNTEKRYLVLQPTNASTKLSLHPVDQEQLWEIDDIKNGLADIRAETTNEFVPQMLNLQLLDAIDFEKGCYMGQEVVARTKYLGRNKRASRILTTDSDLGDLVAEQMEYQVGENWRPGGKILRSGSDQGTTWIFAVVANDTEAGALFRLKSRPEIIFTTQKSPYQLN